MRLYAMVYSFQNRAAICPKYSKNAFRRDIMHAITVIGLGLSEDSLTLGALRAAKAAGRLLLRTGQCAAADYFAREGIAFSTLDGLYEQCEDFIELNEECAGAVLTAAQESDVVYGVFDLRDASVGRLLQRCEDIRLLAGPPEEGALFAFAQDDALLLNASDWEEFRLDAWHGVLLREVDSRALAGECKLKLCDCYPDDSEIMALLPGGVQKMLLCDMDRLDESAYDHRLSFAIAPVRDFMQLQRFGVTQLMEVLARLRAPDGCPWDREQTHASIRQDLLEEAYEVADALDNDDLGALVEELGDVLLQVAFHARIGYEHGEFDLTDVATGICQKLISRHVHVFGEMKAENSAQVLELWQQVKMAEKGQETTADSMNAVARALPALTRARKVAKRAAAVGFCAPDVEGSLRHARSEMDEMLAEQPGTPEVEMEMGDLLLALADTAVKLKIEPERALEKATDKFIRRFEAMEAKIFSSGRRPEEMTLAEMDAVWDEVKAQERAKNA